VKDIYQRPIRQLFAIVLLMLVVSQGVVSFLSWSVIEEKTRPELDKKARVVATALSGKVTRALDHGVPFEKLHGVDDFFADVLRENRDLGFIALSTPDGKVAHGSGVDRDDLSGSLLLSPIVPSQPVTRRLGDALYYDTAQPLEYEGQTLGMVHVGVNHASIAARIAGLRYDIAIVLMTSMLIAFEILLFVVSLYFLEPMRQIADLMLKMAAGDFSRRAMATSKESMGALADRLNQISERVNLRFQDVLARAVTVSAQGAQNGTRAGSLIRQLRERYVFAEDGKRSGLVVQRVEMVRILTFMFMFAEMLSRSFLPIYVGSLPGPSLGLSPDFTASLPLTANLLCVALGLPMAGRWADQVGRRTSYASGAALLMLGLIGAAMAHHFFGLLAARMLCGLGYAILFMACQGYVIDNTGPANRSQGMAAFVSAIMVAEICAPAVGGILADQIGASMVFMFGATVAVIATAVSLRVLDNASARKDKAQRAAPLTLRALLHNRRFVALSLLASIPAKLSLSGFLIYLVPVILTGLNSSTSEIGRYVMVYGILTLLLGPVFARMADRYERHAAIVGIGGVLAGLGLLSILAGASVTWVLAGIAALGLGQAMSIASQIGLVTRVTENEAGQSSPQSVLGLFRLVERLGGACGPLLAGALAAWASPATAMAALGGLSLVCSLLFLFIFRRDGGKRVLAPHFQGAAP
jgi:predicted MFS family arabinose efflux permease/HAMP domain-containing protein